MIGFFDSGSGGLSVLSQFRKLSPQADVVYFGDIQNAPYGERTAAELESLTILGIDVLRKRGATAVVSACNSVSPSILRGASGELPFVEMTTPTATYMQQWKGKTFLLLATPATVDSGIYERALEGIVTLTQLAVPGLAGAIEFGESDEKIATILKKAFEGHAAKCDGVILGCTHYPLALSALTPVIKEYTGADLVIDPGLPVAEDAARAFEAHNNGTLVFLISKENTAFRARVASLFPEGSYTIELV